ncbi:MATE family efflux transporter [Paraglaciecola sp. 20A4]|uniref:MATE family efflux transporter n=1 Tax=Paraglaciecola sp. 20A4 TaxID=2687288 RepID=UPI00140A3026|nr:MATE family efflux transporter [Paraglaciecola sp. 20A4]
MLGLSTLQANNPVARTFWRFAVPSILAMVVSGIYQIIDGIFVGYFVGEQGLAGINLALPMLSVIIGLGLLVGMGGGSVLSNYRGESNPHGVNRTLSSAMYLMLLGGIIVACALITWGGALLRIQGGENAPGVDYLLIMSYASVITIGSVAMPVLIRNDNKPTLATQFIVLGALLNIALDYVLIGHFDMGLKGAAIATVIAQLATCLLCMNYFFRGDNRISIKQFDYKISLRVIQLGCSSLVMFLYFGFTLSLHNGLLMYYGGITHVAAFSVIGYIASLYYFFAEGLAAGVQPPISYYQGAKQYNNTLRTLKLATNIIIGSGVMMVLAVNLFPSIFVNLFTNDETLSAVATHGIKLHLFTLYLDGLFFLVAIYFVAIGKGGAALFVSLGNVLVQLPFLWILPMYMGVTGVWLAVPLSNLVFACAVIPMYWLNVNQFKRGKIAHTV